MTLFGIRWRFFRPAEPNRGWEAAALLTAIFALAVFSGVMWSRTPENSTAFWTANGVLAAGLLLLRPRVALAFAIVCVAINAVTNVIGHLPLALNIAFTSLNLVLSVAVAGLVRTFCGAALDLGRLRRFLPFLLIVGCATLVEGAIGSVIIPREPDQYLIIWRRWAACDATGMVLALPATLMFMRRINPLYAGPANRLERIVLLALAGAGAYLAFGVSAAPVFLLIYPAILFGAFRLGSAWAFVAVWITAQAATVQTLANRGPLAIFDGPPPFLELGILQLFLISLLLTASLATSALAERMRSEQRLRRKAAATAAARARTEQITATRERFLAVVGHEIRTPLNGILGFGEALSKRADLDAEARHQIAMIGHSTKALMEIVDDILDYSQIESGHLELNPAPAAISQALSRALEAAHPIAAAKGLTLAVECRLPDDALHVIDARRLQQVLNHLIGNAVKFTDSGGVDIAVERLPLDDRDTISITVSDTGAGVPEHQRQELFRPFAQLDPSISRKHAGAGLGLSICRSIVDLMGGEISYAPRTGGGSVFRLSLTLTRAEPEAADEDLGERAPRILVVDDHPMNREVARLFLDAFGCEVAECEDGAAAVEAASATAFDVILMDVRMPGVDGLAATRMIRALAGPASLTPILAVTADVMRDDIERCRAAGMNGHVPKPINQARLLSALTSALQGKDAFPADLAA
ncbi:MAG: response regulator [Caulobacterales bacterium]|nr:response regulator [Caulobacterales bacterium]